jgi:hypothetical protein
MLVLIVGGLFGFALTGVLSVTFEWVAEITYPVNESTTAGMLNVSANGLGCLMIWLGEWVLGAWGVTATNVFLCGMTASALFLVTLKVGDDEYLRAEADRSSVVVRGGSILDKTVEGESCEEDGRGLLRKGLRSEDGGGDFREPSSPRNVI